MADQRMSSRGGRSERPAPKGANKPKRKKPLMKKLLTWLFFTGALAVICGIVGYLIIVLNGEKILAENQDAFQFAEASTIYDSEGQEVVKLFHEYREYVELSKIPKQLRDAFVATEDKRFFEHAGVDFWAIGRAVYKDIVARKAVEGGSTITQQLAKNMFLSHEKTFFRKATEASIAVALENKRSKDQILEMYLNRIYFGKGTHGIQAASEYYFGKEDLNELKLWEIATLAGMPKGPNSYNPISNPERSRSRMAVVLMLMREQGLITAEEAEKAKQEALDYEPPGGTVHAAMSMAHPAFVDFVIQEAERVTGLTEEELRLGGYKIHTTLNRKAQQVVEKEFADPDNFEKSETDQIVQAAMMIMDHRTGEIVAIGGGRDYEKKGSNRVFEVRQPGSAFKPITVYGPALETGKWHPWSMLEDKENCYGSYCPSNSNRVKYLGTVSMKQAMKESRNAAAVWLLNQIGVQRGMDFAKTLGFELDKEDRNLAIALGGLTKGVTPYQMTTAYSVFANEGKSVNPHSVTRIESRSGAVIHRYEAPRPKQLMSAESAWYMTEILESVLEQGGTGTRARINRPVAGKTGTTQHGIPGFRSSANRDVWFAGYTPEWTATVWMGYLHTNKDNVLKQSSGQAAALFSKVMSQAMQGMPVTEFKRPANVKAVVKPPTIGGFSVKWSEAELGVVVSWSRPQGNGLKFHLYRKEASESEYTMLAQLIETRFVDQTIEAGLTYEYYVAAYDEENGIEGDSSTKRAVTVPDPLLEPMPIEPELPDYVLPEEDENDGNEGGLPLDPGIDLDLVPDGGGAGTGGAGNNAGGGASQGGQGSGGGQGQGQGQGGGASEGGGSQGSAGGNDGGLLPLPAVIGGGGEQSQPAG